MSSDIGALVWSWARGPLGRNQCDGTKLVSWVRVSEGHWDLYALLPSGKVEHQFGTSLPKPGQVNSFIRTTGHLMTEMSTCQGGMG